MLVLKLSCVLLLLFLCQHGTEAKRKVACEGQSVYLSCAGAVIKVTKANYGRTDRTTCVRGKPYEQTSNMGCFLESSLQKMSSRCDARKSCSVPAVNSFFSDPCVGTHKFLDVDYVCVKKGTLGRNQKSESDSVRIEPITKSI